MGKIHRSIPTLPDQTDGPRPQSVYDISINNRIKFLFQQYTWKQLLN